MSPRITARMNNNSAAPFILRFSYTTTLLIFDGRYDIPPNRTIVGVTMRSSKRNSSSIARSALLPRIVSEGVGPFNSVGSKYPLRLFSVLRSATVSQHKELEQVVWRGLCLIGASGGVPANFTRVRLLGLTAIAGAQSQIVQKNTSAKMVLTMIDGPIAPPG